MFVPISQSDACCSVLVVVRICVHGDACCSVLVVVCICAKPDVCCSVLQTLRLPLSLKYGCPSQTTWMLTINTLLNVLAIGLPIARKHGETGVT